MTACRPLTPGERRLAASVFGDALDGGRCAVRRAKFFLAQPVWITMAPDGDLWFHPDGRGWSADFSAEPLAARAHFIHELTHVWQVQTGGSLVWRRWPWARYRYRLTPGKPFADYGIEQQACIVEDAYRLRESGRPAGRTLADYAAVVPFGDWTG